MNAVKEYLSVFGVEGSRNDVLEVVVLIAICSQGSHIIVLFKETNSIRGEGMSRVSSSGSPISE